MVQIKSVFGNVLYEAAVDTLVSALVLAVTSGANLYGANLPSPTAVLLADWGNVTEELCRDLMTYDASCHPDPTLFTKWAEGGPCPYSHIKVERAAIFVEVKTLWKENLPLCRPYDLMTRLLAEKCPPWTVEQAEMFEKSFKKEDTK